MEFLRTIALPLVVLATWSIAGIAATDDCSTTELKLTEWKLQCKNEKLAMLCRKADVTERRCACIKSGKYFWTYGSKCDGVLSCYTEKCS